MQMNSGQTKDAQAMGISGRIAAFFLHAQITPLLALVAALLGVFAVLVTPREEEPQIDVTMANVFVAYPGANAEQVEQTVAVPAEQVVSRLANVEHVMSVSRPGLAVLTVQFEVGVPRTEALVRLHDALLSHKDWLPRGLGVAEPVVKPKGVDDVPVVTVTLTAADDASTGARGLQEVAKTLEAELKRVPGTRDVTTVGGPGRGVIVELDATRLRALGLGPLELRGAIAAAGAAMPIGQVVAADAAITIDAGKALMRADEVADLVVAVRDGKPVLMRDVAQVRDGPLPTRSYVTHAQRSDASAASSSDAAKTSFVESPAITLSITKKPGQNAVKVAQALLHKLDGLRNSLVPDHIQVHVTRNYGETANDKAQKLIQKLLFATASVVALVFFALGRRESAIVGVAVLLTLLATLFASWAWGFTLNRVSLFALIFSIGILVDDAIVVVENIHRHQQLTPGKPLAEIIPLAVDEVGGPTILATLTVIAALLPMAFVSGLMGPYMSPIPINASMGMLISLAIAFVLTPWLSRLWMKSVPAQPAGDGHAHHGPAWIRKLFDRVFAPFLDARAGRRNRGLLGLAVVAMIAVSVALPVLQLVVLKMLPFDNKSEFQVVVDMPQGTPVERTARALAEMGEYLQSVPEVANYQTYAGLSAPINFNGLVRQYDLRRAAELGDLQVNLVDKHHRKRQSHEIAMAVRPQLQRIGRLYGADVKVVEVPPGPPVMAPIVAEIYGPDEQGRRALARGVRKVFEATPGLVDIDDTLVTDAQRQVLVVDRRKAALSGVSQAAVVQVLQAGLQGDDAGYLQDGRREPVPIRLQLPDAKLGDTSELLKLTVPTAQGRRIALGELVQPVSAQVEQPRYRKDGLPVVMVVGDMAQTWSDDAAPAAGDPAQRKLTNPLDSPLYGLFGMRQAVLALPTAGGGTPGETLIAQPEDADRVFSIKWDGEWQITYETFRDMGAAYAVGLVLIYLLVVAQFGSYLTPLIIMAPIPLTMIGVLPGHALLGAQFTATSMIGMIALAGIIVRNSILLVDFIHLQMAQGIALSEAVVSAAATRAQPIVLTGVAAMLGAFFILDDPIFNGLAISLIFGILISTMLTLVVIPLLVYVTEQRRRLKEN